MRSGIGAIYMDETVNFAKFSLVPLEFYETMGNSLYLHPLRWSPKNLNAEVALWFRFEVTVH
jgi:hypothetical protein